MAIGCGVYCWREVFVVLDGRVSAAVSFTLGVGVGGPYAAPRQPCWCAPSYSLFMHCQNSSGCLPVGVTGTRMIVQQMRVCVPYVEVGVE